MQSDEVILVDEHDQELGTMDKLEAHRNPAQLHRAISVFLFRGSKLGSELLLQQRSEGKIVGALQWANTVCGNLRPGETYDECAHRRLWDELGITGTHLTPIEKFQYQVQCNDTYGEHEMDQVFAGWYTGVLSVNPEEVAQIKWVAWSKISQLEVELAPWFVLMLKNSNLYQKLNEFAETKT